VWQSALTQIKIDPLLGTGSGSFLYYGRKFRAPEVQSDPVRVHNDYLDLAAEYGLLGAAGFIVFLACHLHNGFHTLRWLATKRLQFALDWQSTSLALNIGCLSAVAAYLIHSVVDFNLHIPSNSMLMAFVFGVLANPGLETSAESKSATKTNRVFQFILPGLGLALLVLGTPKIPGEYYADQARIALRDKNYSKAVLTARAGIRWEKRNPDLFYYLGEAQRNIGDTIPGPALSASFYKAASDAFLQGLELFPQDERLLLIEGWTMDALGQYETAETYFDRALEWDPNWEQVRQSYAAHMDLLQRLGKSLPAK